MNLMRLKKSKLVELCFEADLDTKGTIPILKERLCQAGHWNLRYVKIKGGITKSDYTDTEQVSKEVLNSFSAWLNLLDTTLKKENRNLELEPRLREYFDMDVHPKTVYHFIKYNLTHEQCLKYIGLQ